MILDPAGKEVGARPEDLREILAILENQKKEKEACIRQLLSQPGHECTNPESTEVRIKELEFDIGVEQELILKYEQDLRDLDDGQTI